MGEQFLLRLKLGGVHAPAAAPQSHRVLQVEHLVIDDVLDRGARNTGMVEDAANDNRIVRGIVVAEAVAGPVAAPGHLWAGHQAMEKSRVEVFEYGFQVVTAALGRVEMLPSAHLAHQVRLPADVMAGNVTAIAG